MSKPTLIAVLGPTASGKTEWAIQLAEHFGSEILSCDSRQFYRELKIGVARPSEEELARAVHHFIADRSIETPLSAGEYEREALAKLDMLFSKNPVQIVVGGSGLFAKALMEGFDDMPEVDPSIRERLNAEFAQNGIDPLREMLLKLDPEHAKRVDLHNHQRVIRALEICLQTGKPYSVFRSKKRTSRPFDVIKIAPDWEREILYERINTRVDLMVSEGLEEEARSVLPFRHFTALQTVGYREWFDHFDGLMDRETCIAKIKQNSRNYAKRQLTWNRKESDLRLFNPTDFDEALVTIESKLR
ncbi:tRNA (adenosine(37)-N6)-dimethylallyltransferase MiaA [Phaeocystidibacter marisrubri]|uniref:tRNA dimethylallyltransferase n=1 Tax=Phaeocystidibacter marisrubri TaxID=1577780 RepID=A0A6L3ZI26_9FLAO|nr:tRNA (adenosine(37)-N6)-dimethylallyltransferase MiaA [Phaeocystidibacter marisrubri]KAB2817269.1 tRNA (adenosine(37)-N6)-dimethylallyltransferase MiaA [Phaeocystidibacter marisrubri]GGH76162.1 tRNA dimethylallyltransferase [Phaeocystidibacter marisrubri]